MANYADKNGKEKPARKQTGVVEGYDAAFRGYINFQLGANEKGQFDAWALSSSPQEVLEYAAEEGIHFSLRIEPKSAGYLASATQRRSTSPNAGLVVTARGKSAVIAWYRLLFVLAVLSRTERWEDTQPLTDPDRW